MPLEFSKLAVVSFSGVVAADPVASEVNELSIVCSRFKP